METLVTFRVGGSEDESAMRLLNLALTFDGLRNEAVVRLIARAYVVFSGCDGKRVSIGRCV
jgi:hypothetical protein